MKDLTLGLPYKYKKVGYILIALFFILFLSSIFWKQYIPIQYYSMFGPILKIIFCTGIIIIIYTEEKKQDERIILYKLRALARGFCVAMIVFTYQQLLTSSPSSSMSHPILPFVYGIIAYAIKFYKLLRKDVSY